MALGAKNRRKNGRGGVRGAGASGCSGGGEKKSNENGEGNGKNVRRRGQGKYRHLFAALAEMTFYLD
jgi:hypothetical protein